MAGAALTATKYQNEWAYELPLPTKPAPAPIQPQNGKPWKNFYSQWFSFSKDRHVADLPVEVAQFRSFLEATLRAASFARAISAAFISVWSWCTARRRLSSA
jgi:hypothetical protein